MTVEDSPSDAAPAEPRSGRCSITAPQEPTQVSRDEFAAMVRDLGIDEERQPASTGAARSRPAGGRRARANGGASGARPAPPPVKGDGPDGGDAGDGESPKPKKPRNRKHGRPR